MWPLAVTDMTQVILDRHAAQAQKEGRPAPDPAQIGYGDPADVAKIIVYLASDASSHLNGQIVSFNGRKMALWTHPHEVNIEVRDDWTLESIVRDFDATTGRELQTIYKAVKRV